MKSKLILLVLISIGPSLFAKAQEQKPQSQAQGGHQPPPQAYEDCKEKKAGELVQHKTREGIVPATCMESPQGLVARPNQRHEMERRPSPGQVATNEHSGSSGAQQYSIEQAISDKAQLHTIAFDGLAFLTGDFAADTFLPPGKVSDYFGFQYMRDIDANGRGHNTSFLTRIAENMLAVLDDDQKRQLVALGKRQESDIRKFAEMRLPLIKAFRQNLTGEVPAGSKGLNKHAVMEYSVKLYVLDGELAYQRAKVMGAIIRSLTEQQRKSLAALKFGDSRTWPDVPAQLDRRSMSHDVNVAVMTYASEMFSWYAGSAEADAYFCPERHGMYFGGFGMKTAPAMGKQNYAISTSLTGDSGERFLQILSETQRKQITDLLELQRKDLNEIVATRRAISAELRKLLVSDTADKEKVLSLSKRYGELDGELSYLYATAFAEVNRTLTPTQKTSLAAVRGSDASASKGPYLYSSPIKAPEIASTDTFFGVRR